MITLLLTASGLLCFWGFYKSIDILEKI